MKALTLTQPWAHAIAIGIKRIETRSWRSGYRGPLAIHAAKGLGPIGGKRGLTDLVCAELDPLLPVSAARLRQGEPVEDVFTLGAVVATATLVDCFPTCPPGIGEEDLPRIHGPVELRLGDFQPGRFGWRLRDVRRVDPVPCRGELGLWELPAEVAGVLRPAEVCAA